MARFSFVSLLVIVAAAAFCKATPVEQSALDDGTIHITEGWSYDNCGTTDDIVQIESISVSPDPPQPGKDLSVTLVASASDVIEDGAFADVVVKLGLVKLLQRRFDICSEARSANASIQCPVEKGQYKITETVALPKEIPRAKFTVGVRGYTVVEDDMMCLNIKVDFMKNPFLGWGW